VKHEYIYHQPASNPVTLEDMLQATRAVFENLEVRDQVISHGTVTFGPGGIIHNVISTDKPE